MGHFRGNGLRLQVAVLLTVLAVVAGCGTPGTAAPTTTTVATLRVPNVTDMAVADAEAVLRQDGWTITTTVTALKDLPTKNAPPAGHVLSQSPASGGQAPAGATISLTVTPNYVTVPPVRGLTRDEAFAKLDALGLTVNVIELPSAVPAGTAVNTDPGDGKRLGPGDPITLRIAVPRTHVAVLTLTVDNPFWDLIGDNGCQNSDFALLPRHTLQLLGPDGVVLSSQVMTAGTIEDSGSCTWQVSFPDVPEVATYTIVAQGNDEQWPFVSLAEMTANAWKFAFLVSAD